MSKKNYKYIARIYDLLGYVYTGGGMAIAKHTFLKCLKRQSDILFIGSGRGLDASSAKKLGHNISLVENDIYMISEANKILKNNNIKDVIIHSDIFKYKSRSDWSSKSSFYSVFLNKNNQ